jgi:hypothetical protein
MTAVRSTGQRQSERGHQACVRPSHRERPPGRALLGRKVTSRPAGPGVTSPATANGAPVGVTSGRLRRHRPLRHLCHPWWLPAPRERSRRHRRRRCPTGAVPQVRLRALRTGRARRSSGPAAGRTAGPAPVPGRGRAGPGRRRARCPVDRRARRASAASPGGSARGGHGLRPAARPPAPPSGRSPRHGAVPRLDAGRWPSTTSGSGRGCAG